ncbi:hypothetical protein [Okeania sp. SIO2B3]|uniref:hypothetical protein n=1 Tax=Okeania sp. SIO2B3 TaxID=2607784 RepID=UPI0013BF7B92|nr:hypothetical protein [Okeania sp. SIO2B3]NET46026.1 hypothetical protein [Okeania sp. SIO2B3]
MGSPTFVMVHSKKEYSTTQIGYTKRDKCLLQMVGTLHKSVRTKEGRGKKEEGVNI